jgi:hypothetical protein
MAIAILWRYTVAPGQRAQFEKAYGANGDWAALFGRSPDYLGTSLLCGVDGEYLTIDNWRSETGWEEFSSRFAEAYAALDAACDALTGREERIGIYDLDPATVG